MLNLPINSNTNYFAQGNVNGVISNDLSFPSQGICGVTLHFEHEFIGNLLIELISPAGQSVLLVGPQTNGNFTNGANWDIGFVPCNSTPIPDIGFPTTWSNGAPWSISADYTGTYHPFFGCLEDLNTGPVNGIWQLHIVNGPFYTGQLLGFSIEFCEPDGIICEPCAPQAGVFDVDSVAFCLNDPALNFFNPEISFPGGSANPSQYMHQWVVVSNGIIELIASDIDWEDFDSGTYDVYAVSFLNSFQNDLQSFVGLSFSSLLNASLSGSYCLQLTQNHLVFQIHPSYSEQLRVVNICKGDTFFLAGNAYTSSGMITANLSSQYGCDSIVNINLQVNGADFGITLDTITCLNPGTTLDTTGFKLLNPSAQVIQFEWRDASNNVLGTNPSLVVNSGGQYKFSVIVLTGSQLCTIDTVIYVVEQNVVPDDPVLNIAAPCVDATTLFYVAPDSLRSYLVWSFEGNPQITQESDSVYVSWDHTGSYNICVYSVNHCGVSNTVCQQIIVGNTPVYDIHYDSITCDDTIALMVNGNLPDLTWWVGVGDASLIQNVDGTELNGFIHSGSGVTLNYSGQVDGCDVIGHVSIDKLANTSVTGLQDTILCDSAILELELDISNTLEGTIYYSWNGMHDSISVTSGPGIIHITADVSGYLLIDSIRTEVTGCNVFVPDSFLIEIVPAPFATFADTIILCNSFSEIGPPRFHLSELILDGSKTGTWNISQIPGAFFKGDSLDVQFVLPGIYNILYKTSGAVGNCEETIYQVPVKVIKCACPDLVGNFIYHVCDDELTIDLDEVFDPQVPVNYFWLEALGQKTPIFGHVIQVAELKSGQNAIVLEAKNNWAGCCPDSVVVSIQLYHAVFSGTDKAYTYCHNTGGLVNLDTLLTDAMPGGNWIAEPANFPNLTQAYNPADHRMDIAKLGTGQLRMLYVLNSQGACFGDTAIITFDIQAFPTINISGSFQLNCNTGKTSLEVSSVGGIPSKYEWVYAGNSISNGMLPTVLEVTVAGQYFLISESLFSGCRDTLEVNIDASGSQIEGAKIDVIPECGNEMVLLTIREVIGGEGPFTYSLNGVNYTEYPNFNEVLPGDYALHIKDRFECIFVLPVHIDLIEPFIFDLGANRHVLLGDSVHLKINFDQDLIRSMRILANGLLIPSNGMNLNLHPQTTTVINVEIIDTNGCIYEDKLTIFVDHNFDIFVPNAFTPNGDGNNDRFFVPYNPSIKEIVSFDIYDRWGNHLYGIKNKPSGDVHFSWDGTFEGRPMNPAVFVYKIKYTSFLNELFEKYGTFALIR